MVPRKNEADRRLVKGSKSGHAGLPALLPRSMLGRPSKMTNPAALRPFGAWSRSGLPPAASTRFCASKWIFSGPDGVAGAPGWTVLAAAKPRP